MKNIKEQNKLLEDISKTAFGDSAVLKIVDPRSLVLLKRNARYFKKDTFKQLVSNIEKDKRLSSVPLCHVAEDGKYEVLSGNHRIKAAIRAKISSVIVIVILGKIGKAQQIATQLSHNALVGLDDPILLSELWLKIDDIKEKLYAGISSDTINELENFKPVSFTTPQVYTKSVTFAFTGAEKSTLDEVIKELSVLPAGEVYLADIKQFDSFFKSLQKIKKTENIKNGSLAMLKLIEIIKSQIGENK